MSSVRPSPISGVSPDREAIIATVYPSIGSTGLGQSLGSMYDSIPAKVMGIKLSHLLFVLPTAPLAVTIYGLQKVMGAKYVLTNRAVQIQSSLRGGLVQQAPLASIADVVLEQQPGQAFYPCGDIKLVDKAGKTLLTLTGVPRADVFRQTILKARDARQQTEASLKVIRARKPAGAA